MWIQISNTVRYNFTFHEYLPDDDPTWSKHVSNAQIYKY
jgi:hypothetical protein